jgi:hypothetical protein
MMKNSIKCTGWPRIDLWRKENDYLFKKKTKLISKKYGKFILFSSDFGYNSLKILNDRLDAYKKLYFKSKKEFFDEKKQAN